MFVDLRINNSVLDVIKTDISIKFKTNYLLATLGQLRFVPEYELGLPGMHLNGESPLLYDVL